MRVLQINSVCGIGSTGRIATDLHKVLKEQGHESYIAYGRDNPLNCKDAIKIGSKLDNYLHVAKTRVLDRHGFGSRKASEDLVAKIKMINPDVIHLHNLHGYYLNIEILFGFLKEFKKKVIWTLHDCWAFTGHCSYFDYVNCEKWKTGCNNCPLKTGYPSSLIMDQSNRNYKDKHHLFVGVHDLTIATPSQWLARKVKESFLSAYPIEVINNGINLEVFKPQKSNVRKKYDLEEKFVVLGVASIWNQRKGFQYFLDLANMLQPDEVIIMVGLTPKQKKKLPDNIIGIEKTNNIQELADIYSSADVFINPTLEDNFPTTNLEALASGTPVITFNTGGSVESIDDKSGIIVNKGNITGLYEAVKKIQKKPIDRNNCINRSKLYNKENKFNEYIKVYER